MALKLYQFKVAHVRGGKLEGVFVADDKDIEWVIGENINFGEALGKHSEVELTITEEHLTVLSEDADFIAKFDEALDEGTGYNPLDYLDDDQWEAYEAHFPDRAYKG